jgi:hypothetical protein
MGRQIIGMSGGVGVAWLLGGIILGLSVGFIASSNGLSGSILAALSGSGVWGLGWLIFPPLMHSCSIVLLVSGGLAGALWCGIWGVVGSKIQDRLRR